jgi:outer membrane lipoprotein LolB
MTATARIASGALLVLVLLAGCRTAPPPPVGPGADAPWPEQLAALQKFDRYSVTGRVAVAAAGEGFTANLRYRQQADHSDLALDGPLGIGGLRLELSGDALEVTNSRGDTLNGDAARAEIESRLGFPLPLAELRWWLLGIPQPQPNEPAPTQTGEVLQSFEQSGWRVSIDARAPALGFALPRRLTATRQGARMKLLVESWQP